MLEQDDRRLAYEIQRVLGQMPGIDLGNLQVSVDKGRARIQGVVRTYAEKEAAIDAAMALDGIVAVDEAIAVETPHPPADRDLSRDLDYALDENEDVEAIDVGAEAHQGQAVMVGEADSLNELREGIRTAGGVPNTVNVIDSARIRNPYGPDRTDLANAAADALRNHPTLHTRPIRALVEDTGKLVLVGQVHDPKEKREALETVSAVPGVHTVREELEVIP